MKAWNGFILVADIVGFSERPQSEQVRMVQHLLSAHRADPFVMARADRASYLNSTGDGLVFATSSEGDLELPIQFFDYAVRLVLLAREFDGARGEAMEVRVGLHFGSLATNVVRGRGFAVGGGINWCARICDLAAPSQILVSEEYVGETLSRISDDAIDGQVWPPTREPAFSVQVKHNRTALFRALVKEGVSDSAPPRLARGELIGRHLKQSLEILGESLVVSLRGADESTESATRRLSPRLTVWVPNAKGRLQAIRPRIALPPSAAAPTSPGQTTWATTGVPTGPVSAAFMSRPPQAICMLDLPDPALDPDGYARRWSACNVPADVVANFTRKSRSVLAMPLVLFDEPAGVLCVDLMTPLTGQDDLVLAILDELRLRSGYFLSALLHLRAA